MAHIISPSFLWPQNLSQSLGVKSPFCVIRFWLNMIAELLQIEDTCLEPELYVLFQDGVH